MNSLVIISGFTRMLYGTPPYFYSLWHIWATKPQTRHAPSKIQRNRKRPSHVVPLHRGPPSTIETADPTSTGYCLRHLSPALPTSKTVQCKRFAHQRVSLHFLSGAPATTMHDQISLQPASPSALLPWASLAETIPCIKPRS